ncbi:MAG TPA: ATP-binding protein [Geobacteraceae bacterium]
MKESLENVLRLGLDLKEMVGAAEKTRELVQTNPEIAYCVITDMDEVPLYVNDRAYANLRFNAIDRIITTTNGRQAALITSGDSYYDTVTLVKTPDGKTVAHIHVGFPHRIIVEKIREIIIRSIYILVVFVLIAFSVVVVFTRRSIVRPVSTLLQGMKRIAEGAFDTRIEKLPVYELNELAQSINLMAESLKNRDDEIRKNYQELEQTHTKLHGSYLKLEELSVDLERSEDLYKSLMEGSSDAILVLDGNETVKMLNHMAVELFGYDTKEIEGLPLTKLLLLLAADDIPRVHRAFTTALAGGHVTDEVRFRKKQGAPILAKFSVRSIKNGEERLVQAIFHDVTKEREILANLELSAADLARLNKMKDSFLGLASHELKTPLTVIMGYSELILNEMASKVDHVVLEMIKNISTAAARLDNIVKDMVDVSMIDERRLQLRLEEVNVNRLIEASVNELSFFFSMRNQEVVTHLDDTIPLVRGDVLRLMQLLSNILGNAIKFTPDGGRITVNSSAKYLLRSNQRGGRKQEQCLYVEITIKDTGIGIDREDQFRIFDKFYEVGNIEEHSSGKVAFKSKGAGLGLAIAKGIVEMHGGEIWVESSGYDPHTCPGSSFHILLPTTPVVEDIPLNYMSIIT